MCVARLVAVALISAGLLQPATVSAVSTTIVISEFRVRGPNGGSDEFVELYNASSSSVDISAWKLKGSNSSGTVSTRVSINAGVTLAPGCHYLLTNSSSSGGPYSGSVSGNQTYATGITDDGGLAITMANDSIVDQVGLSNGSAFKEGVPLASLGNSNLNRGYERKPGGSAGSSTDTDNNASDFQLVSPSNPQNLGSSCTTPGEEIPPPPFVAIHTIQGSGAGSAFTGEAVLTEGIVTAVRFNNGFFVQTPDLEADVDPNTSEGIFVFTSGPAPAAAAVGNLVAVIGTVQEFRPLDDPHSPPSTELVTPAVRLLATDQALPTAITLTPADTNPAGAIDQLERFEHMRVHVDTLNVIAPTQGNVSEASAMSNSNGVFFGVLPGLQRPFREPGVEAPDPLPAEAPSTVPRFDANPERVRIDSDGQVGAARIDVATGATVRNVTGVLDYSFRSYTILPDPASPPTVSGVLSAMPVRDPAPDEFTIAAANIQRFFDTINDPAIGEPVLTPAAFNHRLNKISLQIREVMRSPDIVGLQEVENVTTLEAIAERLNSDTVAAGQQNPHYEAYLVEGNDIGGIDVAFLLKTSRVTFVDLGQLGADATYIDPTTNQPAVLNDRPSLALRALIANPGEVATPITVVVNHLRSLNGIDDPVDGPRVRAKRRAQAEFLANELQLRQMAGELVVSIGDYNAFAFNDGYVDVMGTIRGAPSPPDQVTLASADLVEPDLIDLAELLPLTQPYSYVFAGSAQELDHILITQSLVAFFNDLQWGRSNADFPEIYRNNSNRPERLSDHDPLVAYFRLAEPGRIFGDAKLEADEVQYQIDFRVSEVTPAAEAGRLRIIAREATGRKFGEFEAMALHSVVFADSPVFDPNHSARPSVDTVLISGIGMWNDSPGYSFVAEAQDAGEPSRERDRFSITIWDVTGSVVLSIEEVISSGSIRSTRVLQ
jgi:predicted extracellular nuclease